MRRRAVYVKGLSGVLLVLIALLTYGTPASAFEVNFRDANLETAIRTALDIPTGAIQDTKLLELTALNASYKDVEYLDGLEFCVNIRQLQLHGNSIKDISPLASLEKLQDLYLWDNDVEDVSPLASLPNLRFLFMQNNNISDVSALGENAQMDKPGLDSGDVVNLTGNPISQDGLCNVVSGVLRPAGVTVYVTYECGTVVVNIPDSNLETEIRRVINKTSGDIYDTDLTSLTTFKAVDKGIVDLTGLEYCKNLVTLNLAGNRIKDIKLIGGLSKLTTLYLGGNEISDLTPLVQNYGLLYLELQNQHSLDGTKVLSNLSGLQFLGGLTSLYLHDNAIADINILGWMLNLEALSLSGNKITDISVLQTIDSLTWLDLGGNQLADDDVPSLASLTNLAHLGLWNNQITSISRLKNLGKLVYLDLSDNQIDSIDVLVDLTNLVELYLDSNKVSDTSALAGLSSIAVISLRDNNVSDISPLAANTGLGALASGQTEQDRLDVRGNQLSQENLCNEIPILLKRNVLVSFDGSCCSESFPLTMNVTGSGTVSPPAGVRNFCAGDVVPLTATADEGWEFDRWEGDVTGNANPTSVAMTTSIHVTAIFRDTTTTYTLTTAIGSDGGGKVTASGSNPYPSASLVTVTAVPDKGWTFDHWEGDLEGSTNPTDIRMNSDKLVRAVFKLEPAKYTLTMQVTPTGKGVVDPVIGDHEYTDGEGVRVTATPVTGWAFDHWEGDLSGSANPNTVAMTENKTVTAVFKKKYTLTMSVEGGGTTEPGIGDNGIVEGTEVLVRATPDLGYVFDHWEGAITGNVNPQTITVTKDLSVKAVFVKDAYDYTLAITTEGLGTADPSVGFHRYSSGEVVSIKATPDDAYVFDHWSGAITGEENPAVVTMNGDKTVQAVFVYAPVIYTLTTSVDGGGTVSPTAGARGYAEGKKVTLTATPSLGWAFDHWEGDVGGSTTPAYVTMSTNMTAKAFFKKAPVVTAISPDSGQIAGGEAVSIIGLQLTTVTSVLFGSKEAAIQSVSDTAITVLTPVGTTASPNPSGAVDVTVKTALGDTVETSGYTFVEPDPAPDLGVVMPAKGSVAGGDVVLIRGHNLALAKSVSFGGTPGVIAASEDTRLYVATLPHEPGLVDVEVTTASGTATLANAYTYVIEPQILGVYPAQGVITGGDTVNLYGVGLESPTQVLFGAEEATVTASTLTQITLVTPANAEGLTDISVTTAGGTATLLQGFDYFSGPATLDCTVLDSATQEPISGATVRLEPVSLSKTTGDDGTCVFEKVRAGDYIMFVSADSYALQMKSITVQREEVRSLAFLMNSSIDSTGGCSSLLGDMNEKISEKVLPLSVEESSSPVEIGASDALAIRLTEKDGVDPSSVWAAIENDGGAVASGGTWRPVAVGDNTDGWVLYQPEKALPVGQTIAMTVGAVTLKGAIVTPITQTFIIGAAKASAYSTPALAEETSVSALPDILGAAKSSPYRITPSGVFEQPATIRIPVKSGVNPAELEIYYYSESTEHSGWRLGGNVVGWIVSGSRRDVTAADGSYIEVQVNHSGVLQLGRAVQIKLGSATPIDFAVSGSRSLWTALGVIAIALAAMLTRLALSGRRV